jgi:hypothetical protein
VETSTLVLQTRAFLYHFMGLLNASGSDGGGGGGGGATKAGGLVHRLFGGRRSHGKAAAVKPAPQVFVPPPYPLQLMSQHGSHRQRRRNDATELCSC